MLIPFSKISHGEEEKEAVCRVLDSGWWAAGKEVDAFEKEFAAYIGAKYFIFTNSCTSALKMSYKWFVEQSRGYNNHLIIPRNTFCATYSAAEEVFGLSEFCSWGYYKDQQPHVGTQRVNMHYGGTFDPTPCLIEDSAHRIEPNDQWSGKIKCYSFYATKNMSTGSGGGLATNDKEIYERTRLFWRDGLSTSTADRLNGIQGYTVEVFSGGYDGNDIAAAMGRVQLRRLPEFTKRRNEIVSHYNTGLNQRWTGNHLFPYMLQNEADVSPFIVAMRELGVHCGYHYPNTGWKGVSLPLYPLLTDDEVQHVIDCVKSLHFAPLAST